MAACHKLIILDRDGVINEDSDAYVKSADEWIPIQGSLAAIARLKAYGYTVAVATNQSGIKRGYLDLHTLEAMHAKLHKLLDDYGHCIDCIKFCPHGPDDGCNCRKPRPGMLEDIARRYHVEPTAVHTVGDALRDYQAAQAAGMQFVLVRTGKGRHTLASGQLPADVPVYADLSDFVDHLLGDKA